MTEQPASPILTKDFAKRGCLASMAMVCMLACCLGQGTARKLHLPVWTFHQRNNTTIGLNLGIASTIPDSSRNVTTIGVHAEAIGLGFFLFMAPRSLSASDSAEFAQKEAAPVSERIHGLSISPLGTICDCTLNGIGVNGGGTFVHHLNGVSAAFAIAESDKFRGLQAAGFNITYQGRGLQLAVMLNYAEEMRGLQLAAWNEAKVVRGVQIGVFNRTSSLKGVQFGIWNVNQKRKLPLFNWA